VVELAAGECARRGLAVGDRVAWASHTMAPDGAVDDAPLPLLAEEAPRGQVLVASRDARFVKLARFLLDGKQIETAAVVPAEKLTETLEREEDVDVVLLDAHDSVATTLTAANLARALRPAVPIVVVAESEYAAKAPAGIRIYDKWNETEQLVAAVEAALDGEGDEPGMQADQGE
jgi:CheY-like chemotaxis protein